jgi:hypothetical protein
VTNPAQLLTDRFSSFREYEKHLLKPTRVYCKRRLTDTSVVDPVIRCKYLSYVSAAAETFMTSIRNHPRRLFDLSNIDDLEDMYYSAEYVGGADAIMRRILILGCMDLVKSNCYEDQS